MKVLANLTRLHMHQAALNLTFFNEYEEADLRVQEARVG